MFTSLKNFLQQDVFVVKWKESALTENPEMESKQEKNQTKTVRDKPLRDPNEDLLFSGKEKSSERKCLKEFVCSICLFFIK